MAEPPDSLMHELIQTVRDNTEKTVAVRADVNRVTTHIYQIITRIEHVLSDEAQERPKRQRELDERLTHITKRLDKQDKALEDQDRALDTIYKSQRWRGYLLLAVVVLLFVGIAVLVWGAR